jgi:hypothetical protein
MGQICRVARRSGWKHRGRLVLERLVERRRRPWATWTGETAFIADWRGNYRIDFRIEWWDQTRQLAWQARRITAYYYFDEWNTAWGGPFPSCMRQPV